MDGVGNMRVVSSLWEKNLPRDHRHSQSTNNLPTVRQPSADRWWKLLVSRLNHDGDCWPTVGDCRLWRSCGELFFTKQQATEITDLLVISISKRKQNRYCTKGKIGPQTTDVVCFHEKKSFLMSQLSVLTCFSFVFPPLEQIHDPPWIPASHSSWRVFSVVCRCVQQVQLCWVPVLCSLCALFGCVAKSVHCHHWRRRMMPVSVKQTTLRYQERPFGNQSFRYKVVSIQVASIRTQAVKMHKNFVHFKYSFCANKKNILCKYSSFLKRRAWISLHLDWINLYRNGWSSFRFLSYPRFRA